MPRLRVGDIDLFYVEAGAGPPLVLVMGLGGDHLGWGLQIHAFAERYRVVAFDNRGAGQSDQPDRPCSIPGMAEDAVGLMDGLGLDQAHVLGISMGGMIAQEMALAHPERVRSLQLHATFARPDRYVRALLDTWRTVRTSLELEPALRALSVWLFAPTTFDERPEFVELLRANVLANPFPQSTTGFLRQLEAVEGHDTLDRLGAIRVPTLVSVAEGDIMVPPRLSREMAARIPGAEFRTVPGAGHGYLWERADAFNAMCLEFLGRH